MGVVLIGPLQVGDRSRTGEAGIVNASCHMAVAVEQQVRAQSVMQRQRPVHWCLRLHNWEDCIQRGPLGISPVYTSDYVQTG